MFAECESLGATLPVPETDAERDALNNIFTSFNTDRGWFWLGITDKAQNGIWRNAHTGDLLTYTSWSGDAPAGSAIYAQQNSGNGRWAEYADTEPLICVYKLNQGEEICLVQLKRHILVFN